MKPRFEVAQLVCDYKSSFIQKHHPSSYHLKTLDAIAHCRTAYLGGHVDACNACNHKRISYNSCRNRHCPKCQCTNRERWIEAREQDLLPVNYFHVVFTVPHELNIFYLKYQKEYCTILFDASKETMMTLGADKKHLGAQMGMISVLHTWGQNLSLHPHVHMIVPGGGIDAVGHWKHAKSDGKYLFPEKVMGNLFRGKFMQKMIDMLRTKDDFIQVPLRRNLYHKNWLVYCKEPLLGSKQVLEYLGRYTHKIAISNHRIKNIVDGKIFFSYKDYAHGNVTKLMSLDAEDFLQRFCLHILPPRFMKIRHYGFLSSRNKNHIPEMQFTMGIIVEEKIKKTWQQLASEKLGYDVDQCPCCKTGRMIRLESFAAHGPPKHALPIKTKPLTHEVS